MASEHLTNNRQQSPDNIAKIALAVLKCVVLSFPALYLCLELYPFITQSSAERYNASLPLVLQPHHYSQIAVLLATLLTFKRWYFWPIVILGFGVNLYWSIIVSS